MRPYSIRWPIVEGRTVHETLIAEGLSSVYSYVYRNAPLVAQENGELAFPVLVEDCRDKAWYGLPMGIIDGPYLVRPQLDSYRLPDDF